MNTVVGRLQIFSNDGKPNPSTLRLVLTTLAHSMWLLAKSVKIILILHKEMVNHLVNRPAKNRPNFMNRNIFNRYGMWFIDMNGLIHEQMGIK